MVNQIRLCPGEPQEELARYCRSQGIVLEAYSPLGTGKIFEVPEMKQLADKYGKTIAQICIRWSLQMGFLPLPKSVTPSRIEENLRVFDFELDAADMKIISGLDGCVGLAGDPFRGQQRNRCHYQYGKGNDGGDRKHKTEGGPPREHGRGDLSSVEPLRLQPGVGPGVGRPGENRLGG